MRLWQVTKYTKGFYLYGAPLEGYSTYLETEEMEEQNTQYQQWWSAKGFRDLYPEGESPLWPTGQPTVLNTQLFLNEFLILLLGDGLRAVAPIVLVTLIVWLQTRSLSLATALKPAASSSTLSPAFRESRFRKQDRSVLFFLSLFFKSSNFNKYGPLSL